MKCVLDASVTLTWLLRDAAERSDAFAFSLLKHMRLPGTELHVPAIWGLEIANVIARSEAHGIVTEAQSGSFLELLAAAPVVVDPATASLALSSTLQIARRYRLSSYDAAYLELAVRAGLPLATLDVTLQKAASKAGVRMLKAT